MKALDLTNQKFGKLIAVSKAPKQNDKYTRWLCQCECGNYAEIRTDYLRNGHTTSCGCNKEGIFQAKDLTGQKFNRLLVLEHLTGGKKRCQCDCGNIVDVETSNLLSGNTQSCGCLQKERASEINFKSLVGQRFGKLIVLERVENNRYNHTCYKCKCDCGNIIIVDSSNLRQHSTNSCGCLKSTGEMIIGNWLLKNNINYQTQYSFDNFKLDSGRRPFFDFAIFNNENNLLFLIEYDGYQHFYTTGGWNNEENLKKTQHRDLQKNIFCKNNNIPLFRIKYSDNIEEKLKEIFNESAEMEE